MGISLFGRCIGEVEAELFLFLSGEECAVGNAFSLQYVLQPLDLIDLIQG
jgi:hypothetical protein